MTQAAVVAGVCQSSTIRVLLPSNNTNIQTRKAQSTNRRRQDTSIQAIQPHYGNQVHPSPPATNNEASTRTSTLQQWHLLLSSSAACACCLCWCCCCAVAGHVCCHCLGLLAVNILDACSNTKAMPTLCQTLPCVRPWLVLDLPINTCHRPASHQHLTLTSPKF